MIFNIFTVVQPLLQLILEHFHYPPTPPHPNPPAPTPASKQTSYALAVTFPFSSTISFQPEATTNLLSFPMHLLIS